MTVTPSPKSTPYEFVGEIPGLGSLELTQLARSFGELDATDLSMFFPSEEIIPRTVVIETIKSSMGLMTMVDMGMPDTAKLSNDRVERRIVEPAVFRESDFLDHGFINQIREYGSMNEATPIATLINRRVEKLVAKRNRTINFFRAQALLGHIHHVDPITKAVCDVSMQIPEHNFFHYQGYFESASEGDVVSTTHDLKAYADLVNDKGRPEALLFQNTDGYAGVPWTHPRADIPKSLRLLLSWARNTNKNEYTDLVMTRDLLTVIMENELIKSYGNQYGIFNFPSSTSSREQSIITPTANPSNQILTFGPSGMLDTIAGLNIVLVDNLYLEPNTQTHIKMWPVNKVAVVARNYFGEPSETLGRTIHPVAEGPGQTPGMWMYTSELDYNPPQPPGRALQIGDAFLPYAVYPQWIMNLTVCEEDDLFASTILRSDLSYGLAF